MFHPVQWVPDNWSLDIPLNGSPDNHFPIHILSKFLKGDLTLLFARWNGTKVALASLSEVAVPQRDGQGFQTTFLAQIQI